jgi:prepilin-type N-terminal cleavage/methylation domain-containing protein
MIWIKMNAEFKKGFSLTEVLMAVGILSVGMMLIATMFPVGIYLTTVASERTMAAIVADEAFAKIQLYGIDPCDNPDTSVDYENELVSKGKIDPCEFSYPPVDPCATNRQYYWSALYRKLDSNPADREYQVTVFVARKTNPGLTYQGGGDSGARPKAISVAVTYPGSDKLQITTAGWEKYVNPTTTIIDNATGLPYRILDRVNNIVTLDRNWEIGTPSSIWVIPPPDTGGRNADIEVYQRIIRF